MACITTMRLTRRTTDLDRFGRIMPVAELSHYGEGVEAIIGPDSAVSLRAIEGGALGLRLDLRCRFAVVPARDDDGWTAESTFSEYRILDQIGTELLVWHQMPGVRFHGSDHPHLHVSAVVRARTLTSYPEPWPLDKLHLPTGPVTLADVARRLIEEFSAASRGDWRRRLGQLDRRA